MQGLAHQQRLPSSKHGSLQGSIDEGMLFLTNRAPQENSRDIVALVGMFLLNFYHILRAPAMCKMGDSRV